MGDAYSRAVLGTIGPVVGLMSTRRRRSQRQRLNEGSLPAFAGNEELNFVATSRGATSFPEQLDVIVTDGSQVT